MKNLSFGSLLSTVGLVAIAIVLTSPSHAAASGSWMLRAVAGHSFYASPSGIPSGEESVTLGADDDIAFGIELEYRINPRFGIELGVLDSKPTYVLSVDFTDGAIIELTDDSIFRPVTAGLVIHLTPERAADVTFTPLVGSADYGDQRYEFEGETATLTIGSGFVWGGRLAVDRPIGDAGWGISFGARYLSASIDGDDSDGDRIEIDLDPLLLTVGVGYSF